MEVRRSTLAPRLAPAPARPQTRAEVSAFRLSGYGAVWFNGQPGSEYLLFGTIKERFRPGCFAESLRKDDPRVLWSHDSSYVLGRRSSANARFVEDATGLKYECDLSDATLVKDLVITPINRRDARGSSIGFIVRREEWFEEGDYSVREIHEAELMECSPCVWPAYELTTVTVTERHVSPYVRRKLEEYRRRAAEVSL